ncbi:MAG: hypothetical protein ACLPPL_16505, partial [Desulfobaccales bacterium]
MAADRSPLRVEGPGAASRGAVSARKAISNRVYALTGKNYAEYYPVSMSCRTVVYKGMVLA